MGIPRKIVQIATSVTAVETVVYALADDGSLWERWSGTWSQATGLPDAEMCGASGRAITATCSLAKGHRGSHWGGGRNWA